MHASTHKDNHSDETIALPTSRSSIRIRIDWMVSRRTSFWMRLMKSSAYSASSYMKNEKGTHCFRSVLDIFV